MMFLARQYLCLSLLEEKKNKYLDHLHSWVDRHEMKENNLTTGMWCENNIP